MCFFVSSIKGFQIAVRDEVTPFHKCFYTPGCILIIQGTKVVIYKKNNIEYAKRQYLLSCTYIPATTKITQASLQEPFIGVLLEFDSTLLSVAYC